MFIKHQLYESHCARYCTKLFGVCNNAQIILAIIPQATYSEENITCPKITIIIISSAKGYVLSALPILTHLILNTTLKFTHEETRNKEVK